MKFFYYLLEVNVYLVLFYGIYIVVFSKLTFHVLNRFYLLGTSLLSFGLPFLKITGMERTIQAAPMVLTRDTNLLLLKNPAPAALSGFLPAIAIGVYSVVVLLLLVLFFRKLYRVFRLAALSRQEAYAGVSIVFTPAGNQPFSFLRFLFVDGPGRENQRVLDHELVHIRQYHSADNIFFEILQCINWFNPVMVYLKKQVKLIHEYIVDAELAGNTEERLRYSQFLLENAFVSAPLSLASALSGGSALKQRVAMMFRPECRAEEKYKYAILLMIIPLIVVFSSCISTNSSNIGSAGRSRITIRDLDVSQMEGINIPDSIFKRYGGRVVNGKPVTDSLDSKKLTDWIQHLDSSARARITFYPYR